MNFLKIVKMITKIVNIVENGYPFLGNLKNNEIVKIMEIVQIVKGLWKL